ncbi:MAG: NADH-quinone oxidoreductase subunit M [Candidatus Thorarchaeota archaeon]|nr:NADH-quinone oxidoreductase subunit M [Candidatus Thorarchaeota archaeon]
MQNELALSIISLVPMNILAFMMLLPAVGAVIAYLAGERGSRVITLLITVVELVLALALMGAIDPQINPADPNVGMNYLWEFTMGTINYGSHTTSLQIALGVDGLSAVMVLLANIVVLAAALCSNHITESRKLYYSLFMLLQTGLIGVFLAVDLMAFFIFWELVLIPMFFIIGRWGEEGSQHAAIKFFIYTHFGSAVMLIGFFVLYFVSGLYTFNMLVLRSAGLSPDIQIGFALAVFVGAGVKLPVWPLHNWLPWAHVKAPTPGSVILAGILLKMGGYGFLRLGLWMVPEGFARLSIPFAALAVFTCIYAAFVALAQTDLKSMVAYTSINHMAWVLLGVAVGSAMAIQGAVYMMFSHGVIISIMFIVAGELKHLTGTRNIPEIKGLGKQAPRLSAIFVLGSLAAFGLPGFSGFLAEFFTLMGAVPVFVWSGFITLGVFLTVGYLLWTLNRIVFSEPDPEHYIRKAPWQDLIAPVLLLIPVILLGFWPDLIMTFIQPFAELIVGGATP